MISARPRLVTRLSLAMLLACTACAGTGYAGPYGVAVNEASLAGGTPIDTQARLLVRKAALGVEVQSVADALTQVDTIMKDLGGFVVSSSDNKIGYAQLTLRVPVIQLDTALDRLAGLGTELRRTTESADVTDEVRDLDAELANAKALRDRMRDLLSRAKDVKDVLAVETELTRLQTQIDTLEGRLEALRRDAALSAIELELRQTAPPKPTRILGPLGLLLAAGEYLIEKAFVIRE